MDTVILMVKNECKKELSGILEIWEEYPENEDLVMLKLNFDGQIYESVQEDFFSALQEIRKKLEKKNMQILCNGAAKNVYPSAMQFSMGTCLEAYKMNIGKPALKQDLVNIFERDKELEFVYVDEQIKFYQSWINSFMRS